jgi:hypothetical protein
MLAVSGCRQHDYSKLLRLQVCHQAQRVTRCLYHRRLPPPRFQPQKPPVQYQQWNVFKSSLDKI